MMDEELEEITKKNHECYEEWAGVNNRKRSRNLQNIEIDDQIPNSKRIVIVDDKFQDLRDRRTNLDKNQQNGKFNEHDVPHVRVASWALRQWVTWLHSCVFMTSVFVFDFGFPVVSELHMLKTLFVSEYVQRVFLFVPIVRNMYHFVTEVYFFTSKSRN